MPPDEAVRSQVEARTQELGRALFVHASRHRSSLKLRVRDRLLGVLSEDDVLRTRLLRFVDVLGALDFDKSGHLVHRLFNEYFGAPLPGTQSILRQLLRFASQLRLPAPVVAWGARSIGKGIASTFLAPADMRGIQRTLHYLERGGRRASLDLLGEQVLGEGEARHYSKRYLDLIAALAAHPLAGKRTPGGILELQLSIKLSSLVADFNPVDPEGATARVNGPLTAIAQACRQRGIGLTIDMEQYEYHDLTWHIFTSTFARGLELGDWEDIGVVIQAYLQEAPTFAEEVVAFAKLRGAPFQVRLVKGAYWDYESIIAEQRGWPIPVFQQKVATDLAFESLIWKLLEAAPSLRLAVGSHNLRSHAYAEAVGEHLGLPPTAIEHQTLYRTAEEVSAALAAVGWVSRDYVPSGDLLVGMSYLVRRVLENASQTGFLFRSRVTTDIESLLRPPRTTPEPTPHDGEPGPFRNQPPRRLFLAEERLAFAAALGAIKEARAAEYPLHLGTQIIATSEPKPVLSPAKPDLEAAVGWLHEAGLAETERAIAIANDAGAEWAARSIEERARVLRNAADLLTEERDRIAAVEVRETGKPWPDALADVDEAIDYLRYYSALALRLEPHLQHYRPHRVVAVIPPWNFPAAIPCGMTTGALVTGNAVILKSAEQSALVAEHIVRLLHKAGVPPEVLIHLPGKGEIIGKALVESPDVGMIAFTGSREVGRWIYEQAAKVALRDGGFKQVLAEMGGKNPILVFADADLDEAVQGIIRSAFGYAGQKCSACSRVLIERPIFERLKARLVDAVASLTLGPAEDAGTFLPPVISEEAYQRLLKAGEVARSEGRTLLDLLQQPGPGYQLGPLLVELRPEQAFTAKTAQEELFGPILAIMPFDSEAEAVRMANATTYALTAGIFSRSPRTIDRVARALEAGDVYVNRETTGARVGIEPFGGYKLSGTGPQAGGSQYLWPFLTTGELRSPAALVKEEDGHASIRPADLPTLTLWPWTQHGARQRAIIVQAALAQLGREWAKDTLGASSRSPLQTGERLLGRIAELAESEPTRPLPGQRTHVLWDTPRGVGLVVNDDEGSLSDWFALVLAPLLAGNGLLVVPAARHRAVTVMLVEALHEAGVPRDVLGQSLHGPDAAVELARLPINFAAIDLDPVAERGVAEELGKTPPEQHWLKARISLSDGPGPDEPGFLRRFALPKTVSIRTLHHGAALEE